MPELRNPEPLDILILGGAGQVGTELRNPDLWAAGTRLSAPGREALDITDGAAIDAALAARPYAAVVNAAAYTAVDKAGRGHRRRLGPERGGAGAARRRDGAGRHPPSSTSPPITSSTAKGRAPAPPTRR